MPVQDYTPNFAGAGQQRIVVAGRYVRVLAADASGVTIKPNNGPPLLRFAGQQIDTGPAGFQFLDVSTTVASTPKLSIATDPQYDSNTAVTATVSASLTPSKTLQTGGDVACANLASTQLIAGDATRLSVIVNAPATGTWATGTVRVGGAGVGAASGIEINPGDTIEIATQAIVAAYNGSGASITLQVLPVNQ